MLLMLLALRIRATWGQLFLWRSTTDQIEPLPCDAWAHG